MAARTDHLGGRGHQAVPGVQHPGAAAHRPPAADRLLRGGRLAEDLAVEGQHRVAADHVARAVGGRAVQPGRHGTGLEHRELGGQVGRVARGGGGLVDPGHQHPGGQPGLAERGEPGGGGRSEDEVGHGDTLVSAGSRRPARPWGCVHVTGGEPRPSRPLGPRRRPHGAGARAAARRPGGPLPLPRRHPGGVPGLAVPPRPGGAARTLAADRPARVARREPGRRGPVGAVQPAAGRDRRAGHPDGERAGVRHRRQAGPRLRRGARGLRAGPLVRRRRPARLRRGGGRPAGRDDAVPRPRLLGRRPDDLGAAALGVVGAAPHDAGGSESAGRAGARLPAGLGGLRLRHDHADRGAARLPAGVPAGPRPVRDLAGPRRRGGLRPGRVHGLPAGRADRVGDEARLGVRAHRQVRQRPVPAAQLVLPTAVVPGTTLHALPYAYAVWFLPVLLWVDLDRLRRGWRPLAGLLLHHGGDAAGDRSGRPRSGRCAGRCGSSRSWCRRWWCSARCC